MVDTIVDIRTIVKKGGIIVYKPTYNWRAPSCMGVSRNGGIPNSWMVYFIEHPSING